MKYQQVSVNYWGMGKAMLTYAFMAFIAWMMLRVTYLMFILPKRSRMQLSREQVLADIKKRCPGLKVTEQDLIDAEKEFDEILKEDEEKREAIKDNSQYENDKTVLASITQGPEDNPQLTEDKKTI